MKCINSDLAPRSVPSIELQSRGAYWPTRSQAKRTERRVSRHELNTQTRNLSLSEIRKDFVQATPVSSRTAFVPRSSDGFFIATIPADKLPPTFLSTGVVTVTRKRSRLQGLRTIVESLKGNVSAFVAA